MNKAAICKGCFEYFIPNDRRVKFCSKQCQRLTDWEWREAGLLDTGADEETLEKHRRCHPKYARQRKLSKDAQQELDIYMETMREIRADRLRQARSESINIDGLIARDSGICHICGEPVAKRRKKIRGEKWVAGDDYPTIDHVIPLSRDGSHTWDNVKLAHWKCNVQKGGKLSYPSKQKASS